MVPTGEVRWTTKLEVPTGRSDEVRTTPETASNSNPWMEETRAYSPCPIPECVMR